MPTKTKILIIEDEIAILNGLIDVFIYHGYAVDSEMDGAQGLQTALSGTYDLILLDVMLPSMDGFSICNQIRKHNRQQPIIMLTAKSAEEDIINGLTLGADDYISKPFSVRELVLRVAALLKRTQPRAQTQDLLMIGNTLKIDTLNLTARTPTDKGVVLNFTRREIEILQYLHSYQQRPVGREELLEHVWGYPQASLIETRTVDIHIAKLRRKIEPLPKNPQFLITVRGEGYRLLSQPTP